MSLYNHQLAYRPLLGGVEIYVPRVDEVGTLGFLAQDLGGGDQRWMVSCYHVLVGGPGAVPPASEGVFQPASAVLPAAHVDALRTDVALDCAAAKIVAGVSITGEILGIGAIGIPLDPEIGMRVIKSGAATGVMEGMVEGVNENDVIIGLPSGFDPDYDLSLPGDSGAVWVSQQEHSPVALHIRGVPGARKTVMAKRLVPILVALRLSVAG